METEFYGRSYSLGEKLMEEVEQICGRRAGYGAVFMVPV